MTVSELIAAANPGEPIQLSHGKLWPLVPGKIPGVWKTPSGRVIDTEHFVCGYGQIQECFTYAGEPGKPFLYCREVEE